jgi:hypothetical protein
MTEEIQEIETLIKQSGELADSLTRLTRKLRDRTEHDVEPSQEHSEHLATLSKQLADLVACSGSIQHETDNECLRHHSSAYAEAPNTVVNGTAILHEAVVELLRVSVTNKAMSSDSAAKQLVKLLRPDLPISQKIEIRETARVAFKAGDDVPSEIRVFLKNAQGQAKYLENSKKRAVACQI